MASLHDIIIHALYKSRAAATPRAATLQATAGEKWRRLKNFAGRGFEGPAAARTFFARFAPANCMHGFAHGEKGCGNPRMPLRAREAPASRLASFCESLYLSKTTLPSPEKLKPYNRSLRAFKTGNEQREYPTALRGNRGGWRKALSKLGGRRRWWAAEKTEATLPQAGCPWRRLAPFSLTQAGTARLQPSHLLSKPPGAQCGSLACFHGKEATQHLPVLEYPAADTT